MTPAQKLRLVESLAETAAKEVQRTTHKALVEYMQTVYEAGYEDGFTSGGQTTLMRDLNRAALVAESLIEAEALLDAVVSDLSPETREKLARQGCDPDRALANIREGLARSGTGQAANEATG